MRRWRWVQGSVRRRDDSIATILPQPAADSCAWLGYTERERLYGMDPHVDGYEERALYREHGFEWLEEPASKTSIQERAPPNGSSAAGRDRVKPD